MLNKIWNGFLRQKTTDTGWTAKRKGAFWAWNLGWLLAALLGLGLLSLYCAPSFSRQLLFVSYFQVSPLALFNIAPVVILGLVLYGLLGRVVWSYGLTAAVVMATTFVNYFKIKFRNDPFLFEDFFYWREAGNMAGKYVAQIDRFIIIAFCIVLLGGLFLGLFVRGRVKGCWRWRLVGLVATVVAAVGLGNAMSEEYTYNVTTKNITYINQWASTQVYQSKGFVYPFLYSIQSAFPSAPDGYSDGYAQELLSQYESADIPEDKQVSVISIMLEAYADFSDYGIDGLWDGVYENLHAMEAESYSGNLVVDVFAGGTVTSERSFLTGYTDLPTFRTDTNSYPWYFLNQGYSVMGIHPCYEWFYNRENVNEYLGYEDYWFVENYFYPITEWAVGMDDVFFPALKTMWEENLETGKSMFSYSITYQGHGPYATDSYTWGDQYVTGDYSEESTYIMNNYFGSIYDTSNYLVDLMDYFNESDEPVVLVFFGDHKPWFGDGNSVYAELGMDFDLSTEAGMYEYYSTPYVIWANDAAKQVTGNDFVGEGPDVSPAFLMNVVFEQIGWEGPAYLQATDAVMAQVPIINMPTGQYWENGTMTTTLSDEAQTLVDNYNVLQYYWSHNFAG